MNDELSPDLIESKILESKELIDEKKYNESSELLLKIIDLIEANNLEELYHEAYFIRSKALYYLKDYKDALSLINDYIKLSSLNNNIFDKYVYYYQGICLMFMNRVRESIESYSKCIESDIELSKSYYYRGLANLKFKLYNEAISDFDNSNESLANYYKANCYFELKDYENSAKYYSQCDLDNPSISKKTSNLLYKKAVSNYNLGKFNFMNNLDDAKVFFHSSYEDFEKLIGTKKLNSTYHENSVLLYTKSLLSSYPIDYIYYESNFLKENKSVGWAKVDTNRPGLEYGIEKLDKADTFIEQILHSSSKPAEFWYLRGKISETIGLLNKQKKLITLGEVDFREDFTSICIEYYEKSLDIMPNCNPSSFPLGLINYRNENYEIAIKYFLSVLSNKNEIFEVYLNNNHDDWSDLVLRDQKIADKKILTKFDFFTSHRLDSEIFEGAYYFLILSNFCLSNYEEVISSLEFLELKHYFVFLGIPWEETLYEIELPEVLPPENSQVGIEINMHYLDGFETIFAISYFKLNDYRKALELFEEADKVVKPDQDDNLNSLFIKICLYRLGLYKDSFDYDAWLDGKPGNSFYDEEIKYYNFLSYLRGICKSDLNEFAKKQSVKKFFKIVEEYDPENIRPEIEKFIQEDKKDEKIQRIIDFLFSNDVNSDEALHYKEFLLESTEKEINKIYTDTYIKNIKENALKKKNQT